MSNESADLVLADARHLKWRALDPLERALMRLCGVCLVGFTSTTLLDVMAKAAAPEIHLPQAVEEQQGALDQGVLELALHELERRESAYLQQQPPFGAISQ